MAIDQTLNIWGQDMHNTVGTRALAVTEYQEGNCLHMSRVNAKCNADDKH